MTEMDEIKFDLKATQYWMKICFMAVASGGGVTARDIKQLLADLQGLEPQDCNPYLLPPDWNEFRDQYYSAFEKVGRSIATVIAGIDLPTAAI